MSAESRRTVELNEPSRPDRKVAELKEHLLSASNELYMFEMKCLACGREVPAAIKRAHTGIRAELHRIEAELGIER